MDGAVGDPLYATDLLCFFLWAASRWAPSAAEVAFYVCRLGIDQAQCLTIRWVRAC